LKIYDERTHLETLLVEKLAPWIEGQVELGLVDKWHFLRYGDPRDHLRLRFLGMTETTLSQIIGEAYNLLSGIEISIDGYFPEIARYGGKLGMEICESAFMADSRMAVEIIKALPCELAVKRWELSVGVLDRMMEAADVSLANRADLCIAMRDGYAGRAGMDIPRVRRMLDSAYRTRRDGVEQAIASAREVANSAGHKDIMELARLDHALELPVTDIVSSLMHMHLNRVLGVSQMVQEVVIYDYLRRHYRSEVARLRRPKAGR
jgi:thiopeptide-type bacteriocin biosynthesis protein